MTKITKKEIQIIKKNILKYLTEDFKGNQHIFDKDKGYQVYNDTDLTMVMDKVVSGLYLSMEEINNERR